MILKQHIFIVGGVFNVISMMLGQYSDLALFRDLHVQELEIYENTFSKGLMIMEVEANKINVGTNDSSEIDVMKSKIIKELKFDFENIKLLLINLCDIGDLLFLGKTAHASFIKLSSSQIKTLKLDDVKNQGVMEFNNIEIQQKLFLLSTDLKKTDFINCRLSTAKMIFVNSKVSEIFTAETNFPKSVFDETKENHLQAQLAFGQLSKAMTLIGDSVKSAEYHSRELHAHYSQLSFFRKSIFFFNLTKLNLWLNWVSNDFGRSWGRGVLFSFGLGAIFFWAMTVTTNKFHIGWRLDTDWKLLPAYFRFMNPLRFFETEKIFESLGNDVTLMPRSYVIDFFARVTIAYGFYQVIQAFRRFGKS